MASIEAADSSIEPFGFLLIVQHVKMSKEVFCGWTIYIMISYDYLLIFLLYLFNSMEYIYLINIST